MANKISNYAIGTRVIVMINNPQESLTVHLLGYGIYIANEVPDENAVGALASHCRKLGKLTPKIRLDDGRVVWGSEVFWGDATQLEELIDDREIVHCDLDIERENARKQSMPIFGGKEANFDVILAAAKEKASKYGEDDSS